MIRDYLCVKQRTPKKPLQSVASYISPSIKLEQAFNKAYELNHLPVDLYYLSTNNEFLVMFYITSVLLVTPDSMHVERLM